MIKEKPEMLSQKTDPQIIADEKRLVTKLAGLSNSDRLEFIDSGWTSRVYLINKGQFVIKFPRDESVKQEYQREITVLRLLENKVLGLQVPKLRWTHPHHNYLGYEGIPGTEFAQVAERTNETTKKNIGKNIGGFLKLLHGLSPDIRHTMSVTDEIREFQEKYAVGLPIITRDFGIDEQHKLHDLVFKELPSELSRLGSHPVLCHGDLGYWNMIIKADGTIGLIDFGDVGYYDEAKDFRGLQDKEVLDAVLEAYGGDDVLRQKIAVRQTILYILDLPFFIGKGDEAGVKKTVARIKSGLAS